MTFAYHYYTAILQCWPKENALHYNSPIYPLFQMSYLFRSNLLYQWHPDWDEEFSCFFGTDWPCKLIFLILFLSYHKINQKCDFTFAFILWYTGLVWQIFVNIKDIKLILVTHLFQQENCLLVFHQNVRIQVPLVSQKGLAFILVLLIPKMNCFNG